MYKKFYGLAEKPFHIVPNPSYLFMSQKHQNALTYLEYGLMERVGFIMLTGEVGTGKTTLIRYLLENIESDMEVAVIFNTNVSSDQILNLILHEFELTADTDDKAKIIDTLYLFLIDRYSQKKRVLLIIDEAQNLSKDALEEIRMLSNLQTDEEMLLQIMIVGQPELRQKLMRPELTQFSQRIAVSYHLSPLTKEETVQYISHRIAKAGGENGIFQPDAIDLIYNASGGIPRTINLLCDAALVYGFADEIETINAAIMNQVIEDKGGMGLIMGKSDALAPAETNMEIPSDNQIYQRIQSLENRVSQLQQKLDEQIGLLKQEKNELTDDLVGKISKLLFEERKRNDRLMITYGKLKEKYETLVEDVYGGRKKYEGG